MTQDEFLTFGMISTLVASRQYLWATQYCDKYEAATSPG